MLPATATDYLLIWKKHFDRKVPKTRLERFWVACHGTGAEWGVLTGVAVFVLSLLDGIMVRSSVLDAGPTLRFLSGIYGCTWGVYFFAFKRGQALRTVDQLLKVAFKIESERIARQARQETKDILRSSARWSGIFLRGMNAWSGFVFVTVLVPAAINHAPANPSWPPPTTQVQYWALFTLHVFSTIFLPVGYFPCVAMLVGLLKCSKALLHAVGERIERAADSEELREAVKMATQLNEGMTLMNKLYSGVVLHLIQMTLLMPLVATYEVINGQVDPFLFSSGPLNVVMFIPLCYAGQGITDASVDMSIWAYSGRWLEEDRHSRSIRLQVMQRAERPAQCKSRELGAVNLKLCEGTLRSWFSFLNFMLNTNDRSGSARGVE